MILTRRLSSMVLAGVLLSAGATSAAGQAGTAEEDRTAYVKRAVTGRALPADIAGKQQIGSGSSFFIRPAELVTNHHVIASCAAVTIRVAEGDWTPATVLASDPRLDLAALRIENAAGRPVQIRRDADQEAAERLTVVGYPQLGRVVVQPISISAAPDRSEFVNRGLTFRLHGLVRPGLSGSPVFDAEGLVVGVITRRLNPVKHYQKTGEQLENDVGIAVSAVMLRLFLNTRGLMPEHVPSVNGGGTAPEKSVAQVGCWK